ncbi:tRNA-uridine aminocarboxypropyltransferase [Thalassotalea mangrovi]|uniref:tRNA-uridine aminocarboxypropyltransferase n=1 Tax=Thalassotalea mangrovi TaxID=2572245 RepID=A0A4U1B5K0_9GAMM|nr:tRNA-uridine aminocarboxypropyltransferase [Thalassotalea mangrovi]TKB45727.1 DTW domain-containing protein [Thalassotalea mangrovi]
MSRQYCIRCQRPLVTCVCEFTSTTDNRVEILLLQHKSEEKQAKGTARLLALSLQHCQVFVGENFSQDRELNALINEPGYQTCLLYPGKNSEVVQPRPDETLTKLRLVVLDGTWKKAYKMLQLSTNLHDLPQLTLPQQFTSNYHIRKHHDPRGLSTLESTVHALGILENNPDTYRGILSGFKQFNDFQLRLAHTNRVNNK